MSDPVGNILLNQSAPQGVPSTRIFLAGDVMLGRLVDQIFPSHNYDPEEHDHAMKLLKNKSPGSIAIIDLLKHKYVWGDMLPLIKQADAKIINLETSVTTSNQKWPNKAFNYRMHPHNIKTLFAAGIDYCSLANNHVLDYVYDGMEDTVKALNEYGIHWSGVGQNDAAAMRPAIFTKGGIKYCCYSFSDHPTYWKATHDKPGINYLDTENYTEDDIRRIQTEFHRVKTSENPDLIVVSIHWGPNYSWKPAKAFQELAHLLIDKGADIIHGHSSHHVQGIEIHKGKPIFYGCGDFVDDYAVDHEYRNDLGFGYFLTYLPQAKKFAQIELVPTKIENFSVNILGSQSKDYAWLADKMDKLSDVKLARLDNGHLVLPIIEFGLASVL